jgi:hypothetical protein
VSTEKSPKEKLHEAENIRDELLDELKRAGIVLPSLGVETVAYAAEVPQPLIELGRCTPEVARKLTAALRKADRNGFTPAAPAPATP